MIRLVMHRQVAATRLRRGRPLAVVASAIAVAGLLAACGSSAQSGSSNPTASVGATSTAPSYAQTQVSKYLAAISDYPSPGPALDANAVAALKGKTILYVPIGLGAAPFLQQQASLVSAFGHLGMRVVTCDPKFVPTAAATCLGNAKINGAAGVITSGIPYAIATNAYRKLEQSGIPTLAANSGPGNPTNTRTVAYMPLDDPTATQGSLQADVVIAQSGGKAKVLYVNANDSPVLQALATVTRGEFTKNCPACSVVDGGFSSTNISQLPSLVSSKLISDPGINYVAIQADAFVPGVLSGVQSSNFTTKVKGVGQTADISVLQMVQAGRFVVADVGVDSSYEGWVEADGLLRLLTGQPITAEPFVPIRVFDAANLKGLRLSATTDVDSLFGSSSFKATFFMTWGVA